MKNLVQCFITYFWIFLFMLNCQPKEDPQAELSKVEKLFHNYFDGISRFDYQAMRQVCAPDFIIFEDGTIWSVEDHINFLKTIEGQGTINYSFHNIKSNIDGSTAWITHRNVAEANMGGNAIHFEWLESAVFKRIDDNWTMVFLHSTTAKPL